MTSGEFQRIPLERITVVREDQLRREIDPKYIRVLADDIGRVGPIHPPVVFPLANGDFKIIAGECRFEAYKLLGWDAAMFQITYDPDFLMHSAIKLSENIKRKDVTWQNQRDFVTKCHENKMSEDPSWTQEKTGLFLGLHQGTVSKYLQITERRSCPQKFAANLRGAYVRAGWPVQSRTNFVSDGEGVSYSGIFFSRI